MIVNNTCFVGNDTSKCLAPRSSAGLTAGLTVFFLLLAISAGVIAYKCRSKLGQRRRQKKKDGREMPAAWSHEYVSVSREQSAPVYENLTTQTAKYNLRTQNQGRLSRRLEDDLYLQCDLTDDAIYSNDPACSLSILTHPQEEDVYIVPDA